MITTCHFQRTTMRKSNRRLITLQQAIFLLMLLTIPSVSATQVKYYSMPEGSCQDTINSIPKEYYKSLRSLQFYNRSAHRGDYYPNQIRVFSGCDLSVLIHELAHHQQFIHREKWGQILRHTGNFSEYEEEIQLMSEWKIQADKEIKTKYKGENNG